MGNIVAMAIPDRSGREFESVLIGTVDRLYADVRANEGRQLEDTNRRREEIKDLMRRLFGNGQPGEIGQLKEEIRSLRETQGRQIETLTDALNRCKGALWVLGSLGTIGFAVNFFVKR